MPEINFFWDPLSDNILQERDAIGALTAEYTTEPGLYGNVTSQNRGGLESQFHFDAIGSTLAVTDDNQQVTDTRAYSAFGETTENTGSTTFPFQYVGEREYYQGTVTGQYTARRRPYQPLVARWLSVDPMEVTFDNRADYVYSTNSPCCRLDPGGMMTVSLDPAKSQVIYGCGGFDVFVAFSSTKKMAFDFPNWYIAFVKRSCISYDATYCQQFLPCSFGCGDFFCNYNIPSCCFYEAAVKVIAANVPAGTAIFGDRIRHGPSNPMGRCPASRGHYKRSSEVRLFHLSDADYEAIVLARGRGQPWNGSDVYVECDSSYGFFAAGWSRDPPPYWDAHVEAGEPIKGRVAETRLISSVPLTIAGSWDCCDPAGTQELWVNNSDVGSNTRPSAYSGPYLFSRECRERIRGIEA